jgi:hypothetical protein
MIYPSLLIFTLDIVKYCSLTVHLRHIDGGRDTERDGGRDKRWRERGIVKFRLREMEREWGVFEVYERKWES